MADFIPSPQQQAGFDWTDNGEGNAFVKARAGTGKTTFLREDAKRMKGRIVYCVFAKKNQLEAAETFAAHGLSHVDIGTYHALGFRAWRKVAYGVKVEEKKKWDYLLGPVPFEYHAFVRKSVDMAKQRGLGVFGEICDVNEWIAIADHYNLHEEIDQFQNIEVGIDCSIKALEESNNIGREVIDFGDMIYLPVLHGVKPQQYDWLLSDEDQDSNNCRRAWSRKMMDPNGRGIFVGDPAQAIMGFAGADNDACDVRMRDFNCCELPLTVTRRCPRVVVGAVTRYGYVDDFEAHESAPLGEFFEEDAGQAAWDIADFQRTDAILCRNTKPLVELAYGFIRRGIGCHVEGRDIGQNLLNMIAKWNVVTTSAYLNKLDIWETRQTERLIAKGNDLDAERIRDKVDTLRILCEGCSMLSEVRTKVESLFEDTNGEAKSLTLSTIHKSKGREWPNVYVYGFKQYLPSKYARSAWQLQQESNLAYVAFTRAKERLVLVG